MKPTIITDAFLHSDAVELLNSESRFLKCESGDQGVAFARSENAAGAILGPTWQFTGDVIDAIPSLLAIGRPGIGVDNIDVPAATQRGVVVVNTPDAPAVSTAEHTLSLMLAAAKGHKTFARVLEAGESLTAEPPVIELHGKTLGLVGLGRIGGKMARICGLGLGMQVLAYDPYVQPAQAEKLGVKLLPNLHDVLAESDFVSIHCPPAENTRGLIDSAMFAAMKPTAYLINCARGVIVDETALISALQNGEIAGAGLDVFDPEPPETTNPLLAMENVIATPHTAAYTDGALREMGMGVAREVLDAINGKRPDNMLNLEVWNSPAMKKRRNEK